MIPIEQLQTSSVARWLVVLATVSALCGCQGMRDVRCRKKPSARVAAAFQDSNSPYITNSPLQENCWWRQFGDPKINSLVQQIRCQNLTIKTSCARIDEAIHLRNMADLKLVQIRPPQPILPGMSVACLADARVCEYSKTHQHAINELIAKAVELYINIRATDERLQLAHSNVDFQEHNLELAEAQFDEGRASKFDLAMAVSNLETIRAAVPQLEMARRLYSNGLAVIAGRLPGEIHNVTEPPGSVPAIITPLSIDKPSCLLHRRADLAAAAARYSATSCKTEDFGTRLLCRFNPELLHQAECARQAKSKQALFDYRNIVLTAHKEVEDATIEFIKKSEQLEIETKVEAANHKSVELALAAFKEGRLDYTKVLALQSKLALSRNQVVETRRDVALALVKTYRSIGYTNLCNSREFAAEPTLVAIEEPEVFVEADQPAIEENNTTDENDSPLVENLPEDDNSQVENNLQEKSTRRSTESQ